jgi:anti-sigma factor RsiW
MSCSFREYLSPYSDGELDTLRAEEIKGHLETCVSCQGELNSLLQIRDSLQQGAASTKAPLHLKEKILGETRQAQRKVFIPRWNFARASTLVAAVLFAFILAFYYWPQGKDSFTDLVDILVKYHAVYGPGGKSLKLESSNSREAALWFKKKLGLEFSVPNAAFAGYSLKGADAFEQEGRKFAYLRYQGKGKGEIVGYIIFKDSAFSINLPETVTVGKIKLQIGKKKETNMAVWKKGGLVYLILTTEDRSELLHYARRCIELF